MQNICGCNDSLKWAFNRCHLVAFCAKSVFPTFEKMSQRKLSLKNNHMSLTSKLGGIYQELMSKQIIEKHGYAEIMHHYW